MLLCCRKKCVNTVTLFKRMPRDCIQRANSTERSGSVVECSTQDRGVVGSSLTSVTALCP